MLWENVINSIKGYIKGRNSSVKKLGKVNKKLNDSLESSPNISKIKEAFQKELFGVLKPNHISVNAKLFDVIKNIWENLEQIKKEPVLGRRIKDIEFNTNAIEVNGITIKKKKKPSHLDPADTQNSINEIEKSYQILTELERIIPKLEKRFKDNIRILSNIRDKQKIFSDTSRESNENDEKLGEITSLKEQLQINPITIQGRFLPFWDDETVAKVWDDSETTDGYIKDFQNHLAQLNNFKKEVKNIHKRYKKNKDNLEKIMELQKFHERINNGDDIKEYQGKLDAMVDICKNVLCLDGEAKTKEIANRKIKMLKKLINGQWW